jgi:hypothetical protein
MTLYADLQAITHVPLLHLSSENNKKSFGNNHSQNKYTFVGTIIPNRKHKKTKK